MRFLRIEADRQTAPQLTERTRGVGVAAASPEQPIENALLEKASQRDAFGAVQKPLWAFRDPVLSASHF